ncbi:MAG: YSC84-related protein [Syntrophobacteraceae bacterium]|nr:YSC84-related protein [Syntrophobacteraceae bacterium]
MNVSTHVDTRGGFIGASAEGLAISVEQDSNNAFYGNKIATANTIVANQVKAPKPAKDLPSTADKLTASRMDRTRRNCLPCP